MRMIAISAVVVVGAAATVLAGKAKELVVMPAEEMKYTPMTPPAGAPPMPEGMQPPEVSNAWGDMTKGDHGAIVKLSPAKHGLHTHTSDVKGVVISGTFAVGADEASAKKLSAGSYFMVPGGLKHYSACEGTAPCVLFQQSTGKFDMKPAK